MTQLADNTKIHLSNFDRLVKDVAVSKPWLAKLRKSAMDRFERVGFPGRREEHWRQTNFDPIARTHFELATGEETVDAKASFEAYTFGPDALVELVFINGQYCARLSKTAKLPQGVRVESLARSIDADIVEQNLGQQARIEASPFVALNTGFVSDGALVHLPSQAKIDEPIHLLFISTGGEKPTVSHPRVLVVAGDKVEATIVESYVGAGTYFSNAVTEIEVGEDCRIDHCKLQQESASAFHVATMQVRLAGQARFVSHAANVGAKLSRNDLNVVLDGRYADATLNGLVIIGGEQHCDNHTLLDHEKSNCPSHELYKHVLSGRATGVFKGKIFVQKDAQKTDSKQTSKSLLLSDEAYMNSQPALEIYADDVKCTHGSTTGPVDDEAVFYLRSRGVSLEAARHLLTYAFAADVTRRIRVAPVRRRLEDFMAAQHGLPQDLRITDLGAHDERAR
jgi:Fe-S cluster assembly protein SufD